MNVLDGSFTTEQMSVELERLLPDKETWNLQQQGVDSFSLNFPSAVLLDQMVKWGPMETKTAEGKISFEKGVENEVFKYEIPCQGYTDLMNARRACNKEDSAHSANKEAPVPFAGMTSPPPTHGRTAG